MDRPPPRAATRSVHVRPVAAGEVATLAEPLFREYGQWVARRLRACHGVVFTEAELDAVHTAFRAEVPRLLGPGGRLVVAEVGGEPAGVGALKPVDPAVAELKRMYVRPSHQGQGVGRVLAEHLLAEADALGYTDVRLETVDFMTAARALYRSLGFVAIPRFPGSEVAASPLQPFARYLLRHK